MKKYILAIILSLNATSAFAKLKCSKNGTTLIYVNGIDTTYIEANKAIIQIRSSELNEKKLIKTIDSKENGIVIPSYNTTMGIRLDLFESTVQKLITEWGLNRDQAWHALYLILKFTNLTSGVLGVYGIPLQIATEISVELFKDLIQLEVSDDLIPFS